MLIPYRVKNPCKHFPYATLAIIALNVLVFGLTSEYFLGIREDVVESYAFQLGVSPILHMLFSMFLHADILHLGGNMLFFWVFGPPVEDRLGVPRFLLAYFITGILGDLLQAGLDTLLVGQTVPGIGASGCIMGVLGAYWYVFPWSTVCVFYWFGWFFRGVWEVQAFWIIGLFILMDLGEGFLSGTAGGVANFAHVGGGVAGALFCLALRMKRDSERISQAKAVQADFKDLSMMPLADLEIMRREDPENPDIVRAMIHPAFSFGRTDMLDRAFGEAGAALIGKDPKLVVQYLFDLKGDHAIYTPAQLMQVARYLEGQDDPRPLLALYQIIRTRHANDLEHETALYRSGRCYWEKLQDAPAARACLEELLQRYPFGTLEQHARVLLKQLP